MGHAHEPGGPGLGGSGEQLERAALLLGSPALRCARARDRAIRTGRPTTTRARRRCGCGLGEASYRSCWERGHALGREQVVAAALEDAPADQHAPAAPPRATRTNSAIASRGRKARRQRTVQPRDRRRPVRVGGDRTRTCPTSSESSGWTLACSSPIWSPPPTTPVHGPRPTSSAALNHPPDRPPGRLHRAGGRGSSPSQRHRPKPRARTEAMSANHADPPARPPGYGARSQDHQSAARASTGEASGTR